MTPLLLEELSLSEWPALETQYLDGWILRFSRGYTKRSNSVSPLYGKNDDFMGMEAKVRTCEELYRARGLPPIFKLTGNQGSPLDSLLEKRGYTVMDPSLVMVRDLSRTGEAAVKPGDHRVEILPRDHGGWLEWSADEKGLSTSEKEIFRQLASGGSGELFHVRIRNCEGLTVSGATGVVNRNWLGILNVFTPESHRRRGYALDLITHLLEEGARKGAEKAYLAVIGSNTAARNLYLSLGFIPHYTYWYRIKK